MRAHRQGGPALRHAARHGQIHFDVLAAGEGALGGLPHPLVEELVSHQSEFHRTVVTDQHVTQIVDDHHTDRGKGDRLLQHLSDRQPGC